MTFLSSTTINMLESNHSTANSSSSIRPMRFIEALPIALVLSSIVVLCIFGNILVILSVFTFRPLRTVQNFFIVSLAFSDMFVAVMVMPFHIVKHILNRWIFGQIFCQIFVTSDVLLCTSSILNLCAIALDRYWAISDPIQYARQRTVRRVLIMILFVWLLSAAISIPPIIATMLGSSELQNFNELQCELSQNRAYVIYSACGSFYIPALIMTIVYAHVFIETRKRFRERAKAAAKLANVTRKINEPTSKMNAEINHSRKKLSKTKNHACTTTTAKTFGSSLKSLASNGSATENLSIDDVEESIIVKKPPLPNNKHVNQAEVKTVKSCKVLFSINIDEHTTLSNKIDDVTVPLCSEFSISNNGFTNQQQQHQSQNVFLQTIESSNNIEHTSKTTVPRRSLFKGKSLATLMNERQKISLTRERRLSRTLGIIIGVFLLCWLPFFVVYILSAFIDVALYIKEPLPTLCLWLGYMNSACNPLIYTVFNVEFRTAFKRLLCPRLKKKFSSRY